MSERLQMARKCCRMLTATFRLHSGLLYAVMCQHHNVAVVHFH